MYRRPLVVSKIDWDVLLVFPSNMNPVGAEGNIFSSLFDKVPAKRAGCSEDIAGTVLYLVSKAGVSHYPFKRRLRLTIRTRRMLMVSPSAWMVVESC